MDHQRAHTGEEGFTLVELTVATTILLVVFVAALGLLQIAGQSEPEISSENARIQAAQVGIERLSRELRQSTNVIESQPNRLTVQTYLPRTTCGGSTVGSARLCQVTYACAGGQCLRTPSEPGGASPGATTLIAENLLSDQVFGYRYTAGTPTPTRITVDFAVQDEAGSSEDAVTLRAGVALRNVSLAEG